MASDQNPHQQHQQYPPHGYANPPSIPQITTNFPSMDSGSRPTTMNSQHSYSLSSPAASQDQKYTPFSTTPDQSRYGGISSSKWIPQTPTGAPSQSPLALADIRPRTELHLPDDLSSPSAGLGADVSLPQTPSSYIAPWQVYSYDWCNWPVNGGSGAGKMAICSYLEDPHNFVSLYHCLFHE